MWVHPENAISEEAYFLSLTNKLETKVKKSLREKAWVKSSKNGSKMELDSLINRISYVLSRLLRNTLILINGMASILLAFKFLKVLNMSNIIFDTY